MYYPSTNREDDAVFWVPRSVFDLNFDLNDFRDREVINIDLGYMSEWFFDDNGKVYFDLPVINFINGKTQFVNGRHRTEVLYRLIDCIPMGFVDGEARDFAVALGLQPLIMEECIKLPELEFLDS